MKSSDVIRRKKRYTDQGYTNYVHQVSQVTKFSTVAPNITESSMCNLHHVTLMAPRILRWLLDFGQFMYLVKRRIKLHS
jgi:hypothetical protein